MHDISILFVVFRRLDPSVLNKTLIIIISVFLIATCGLGWKRLRHKRKHNKAWRPAERFPQWEGGGYVSYVTVYLCLPANKICSEFRRHDVTRSTPE